MAIYNAVVAIDDGIEIGNALAALGRDGVDERLEEGLGIGGVFFKVIDKRDGFPLHIEMGGGTWYGVLNAEFVDEGELINRMGNDELCFLREVREAQQAAFLQVSGKSCSLLKIVLKGEFFKEGKRAPSAPFHEFNDIFSVFGLESEKLFSGANKSEGLFELDGGFRRGGRWRRAFLHHLGEGKRACLKVAKSFQGNEDEASYNKFFPVHWTGSRKG